MKIIVKGIMTAEDAHAAASCPGVAGVICSNHGGRQLDGTLGAAVLLASLLCTRFAVSHCCLATRVPLENLLLSYQDLVALLRFCRAFVRYQIGETTSLCVSWNVYRRRRR